MKHKFLKTFGALVFVGALMACNNSGNNSESNSNFKINGTVCQENTDSIYYVYIGDENFNIKPEIPVDTIIVKDKKFSYQSNLQNPTWILLQPIYKGGKSGQKFIDLVLVPGEEANINVCSPKPTISGSTFYSQWRKMDTLVGSAQQKIQTIKERLTLQGNITDQEYNQASQQIVEISKTVKDYIFAHKDEEATLIYGSFIGIASQHEIFDDVNPEIKNGRFKNFIARQLETEDAVAQRETEKLESVKNTLEGNMFTDFSAEYEGKTQKLSDYVGKGKYVLVDFWASWCGPCKAEIPNLINIYNKYKGKNFEVLGVASWDKPADSQKTIETMQIPYPQIMNAQKAGTDAYGIEGIPQIILFGPDGTILKRNLRGAEIEKEVKKYLKK